MAQLSVRLFGGFDVTLDGESVTGFDSNKVRALLAYLAVESARPQRRESLATLLWPGYPERSARTNLRNALANLRAAIGDRDAGPPFLLITRETIRFNRDSDHWVDVEVVADVLASMEHLPTDRLAQAADVYIGGFLAGFTLADAVGFDDWASVTRQRMHRRATALLGTLVDRLQEEGDLDRALSYAWRLVELEPLMETAQRRLMQLLAKTGRHAAALRQYETYRRLLDEEQAVESSARTQGFHEWLAHDGLSPGPTAVEAIPEREPRTVGPSPYRGLAAFRELDAPFFYGRAAFVERLMQTVTTQPLVTVVVGPSGSGKSSVTFAGLLPRLRDQGGWLISSLRPGREPFYALAAGLCPLVAPNLTGTDRLLETRKLAAALKGGDLPLSDVVNQVLDQLSGQQHLMLLVDQFEELYTLCPDQDVRRCYIDTLLAAVDAGAGTSSFALLLTLRADFMGQALTHRPFADVMQGACQMLGPMTRAELRAAIEEPAEIQGAAFERGLVARLLDDVGEEPGNLPLLEFALTLLWERLDFGWLTHTAYERIGGVDGALARYAQQIYEALSDTEQELFRRVFIQLVQPGDGTEDTRRVAGRDDVGETAWELVQRLADQRLVVTSRDELNSTETVEVVHEALINNWGQLQAWMAEDRTFRTWQERLRGGLRTWEATARDEGALLRGVPLTEAEEWLRTRAQDLSETDRAFVEAGISLRTARRQRELESARQLAEAHDHALQQAAIGLASEARNQMQGPDQDVAVLLALEAVEHYPYTWQAERALADIVLSWRLVKQIQQATQTQPLQISPDGLTLLSPGNDGVLRTWDLASARNVLTVQAYEGSQGNYLGAQWSPSGDRILSRPGGGGNPRVWDATTGRLLAECSMDGACAAEWSPDGQRILRSWSSQTVTVWDAQTGSLLYTMPGNEKAGARFSPNGRWIATSLGQIWDARSGEFCHALQGVQTVSQHRERPVSYHWSPDGDLVGAGKAGTAWVWDAATGAKVLTLHTGYVGRADLWWSPSGDQILTTGFSGDGSPALVWDARTGERLRELPYYDELHDMLDPWSPTGDRILLGNEQGNVTIWESRSGRELLRLHAHRDRASATWLADGCGFATTGRADIYTKVWRISTATFTLGCERDCPPDTWDGFNTAVWSPDGNRIARPFDDGSVRVWDVASRAEVARIQRTGHMQGVAVNYVAWSPDSRRILTGAGDGSAELWDSASGERLLALAGHGDAAQEPTFTLNHVVMGVAWAPDGHRALTCGRDRRAVVWDTVSGKAMTVFEDQEYYWGAWSPDGSRIVLVDYYSYSGPVRVWDPIIGEALLTLLPDDFAYGISAVDWSPDGSRIVTFSEDRLGRLWDAATGQLIGTFTASSWEFVARWSPSGNRFLVGGPHGLRVWDAHTLKQIVGYPAGTHNSSGSWSPDGTAIAIGYANGDTKVYPAWQSLEELVAYAKAHCVLRELTAEERAQFGLPER